MPETSNVAIMAERISDEIFSVFRWKKTGPINQNWSCVKEDSHHRKTHPSDVVFSYPEPYEDRTTYINCDLKSYAKGSISKAAISAALANLADSVACANASVDWQELYASRGANFNIHGLLFVYNHDGEYDNDFRSVLHSVDSKALSIPTESRLYVLQPSDIAYLATVAFDINALRGKNQLPNDSDCTFFYPDLVRKRFLLDEWTAPATIDVLTGPLLTIKYRAKKDEKDFALLIYYRGKGESRDEFIYLLEYLSGYQMLKEEVPIQIRLPNAAHNAQSNFQQAKTEYLKHFESTASLEARIEKIKCASVVNFVSKYSEIAIGMEYER